MKVKDFCENIKQVEGDGSISVELGLKRLDDMKIGFGLTFYMKEQTVAAFSDEGAPDLSSDLSLESIPVYKIDGEWETPDTNFQRQVLRQAMQLCGILKGVKLEIVTPKDHRLDGAGFVVPSMIQTPD